MRESYRAENMRMADMEAVRAVDETYAKAMAAERTDTIVDDLDAIVSETSRVVYTIFEPPVAPGMTRLYHKSATSGRVDGPAWFSTNRTYAENYREGGELQYVDYPTAKVNEAIDPDGIGQTVQKGFTWNVELDSTETGLRKTFGAEAGIIKEFEAELAKYDALIQDADAVGRAFEAAASCGLRRG
jgi:hypothetical protein